MTRPELNRFRQDLEARQSELATSNREALAVETDADEMDRIQRFSEREYEMNYLERNSTRLREVRAALRRMDEGTYGTCAECEEPIGLKRMTAVPWTATCIACQEAVERAAAAIEDGVAA
jgi:DnaK suppressor protein